MTTRNPADAIAPMLWLFGAFFVLCLLLLVRWVYRSIRAQIRENRDATLQRLKRRMRKVRRDMGTMTW